MHTDAYCLMEGSWRKMDSDPLLHVDSGTCFLCLDVEGIGEGDLSTLKNLGL